MIQAALSYAARGWPVFPCHGISGAACACRSVDCSSPGKHPRVARGLHTASTDPKQIQRWWERSPTANIGLRTGTDSGLVVLDVDPIHGGSRTIKTLIDRHGDLPHAPRVRTGSGGWHLFFAHPGEPIRNSASQLGPGLDIRGDGGYVIAPPSLHASGQRYRWEIDTEAIPPMPDWLFTSITRPAREVASRSFDPTNSGRGISAWARAALEAEIRTVQRASQGSRNTTLNRSAFHLGQIIGAGLLDKHDVEPLLIQSGVDVGLGEREVIMTVRSGLSAGLAHPRDPSSTRSASLEANRTSQVDALEVGLPG